jgi:hypothetical protein
MFQANGHSFTSGIVKGVLRLRLNTDGGRLFSATILHHSNLGIGPWTLALLGDVGDGSGKLTLLEFFDNIALRHVVLPDSLLQLLNEDRPNRIHRFGRSCFRLAQTATTEGEHEQGSPSKGCGDKPW